ncbi:MAG: TetR/AcrR family transcriptional regulator, partial [Telluria sp.]
REIGEQVAGIAGQQDAAPDPLLQAGVVGGVIHIALRWIEDGYTPAIDSVIDSAMRLVMVEARPALAGR